jgi:hypothetical protein
VTEADQFQGLLYLFISFHSSQTGVVHSDAASHVLRCFLFLRFIFLVAVESSVADEIPEEHVIFGECAGLIGKNILDLPQIFID